MKYAELKIRLLADLEDFLDNGFRQKLVKAVKDAVLPELQTLVLDLHTRAMEAREGVWIHEKEIIRQDIDRKTTGLADRIGTMEMYMPQIRVLGDAVKSLQVGQERQQVATARLETATDHLEKVTESLGGKINGQAGEIDDLQDKPGKEALQAKQKLKWLLIGGGISLGVMILGGVLLSILT